MNREERNRFIVSGYRGGLSRKDLAIHFGMTEAAITYILKQADAQVDEDEQVLRREAAIERRKSETPNYCRLEYRLRYLPRQLDNARRKVAALESEAKRLGLHDMVSA